jgi:hypothetical protein
MGTVMNACVAVARLHIVACLCMALAAPGPALAVSNQRPGVGPAPGQPPPAQAPSLTPSLFATIAAGRWAIGSRGNCKNPRKVYTLELGGDTITWRDGAGNVDVETIEYDTEDESRTATLRSEHASGNNEPRGTVWTYDKTSEDSVRVRPAGKSEFVLVKCP